MFGIHLNHWESLSEERQDQLATELKYAFRERSDNFTSLLLCLLQKSDVDSTYRLSLGFPDECAVVSAWKTELITKDFQVSR